MMLTSFQPLEKLVLNFIILAGSSALNWNDKNGIGFPIILFLTYANYASII